MTKEDLDYILTKLRIAKEEIADWRRLERVDNIHEAEAQLNLIKDFVTAHREVLNAD